MRNYSLTHVSDAVLLRDLASLVARDRLTTADLLSHIAEVDARRLYAPAGYSSMHSYCVEELRLSEDASFRRIRAARAARSFPVLFEALAEGKLHLAAVSLLAAHLTGENVEELIEAAAHRRKSEIEEYLARRFGPVDVRTVLRPVGVDPGQLVPGRVELDPVVPELVPELVPGRVGGDVPPREMPRSQDCHDRELVPGRVEDERYLLQVTLNKSTREKLRYAQALLSHSLPGGDVAQVLDRALDSLILQLEKRKFGSTARPRSARPSVRKRHVAAEVRRKVWVRDQGRCTFVSTAGRRCNERRFLEFDHVEPVARGGRATIDGMRLRCRAHNQYEAERAFGAEFMSRKRDAAADARAHAAVRAQTQDVLVGLRHLGCRPGDARRAAEYSGTLPVITLEERMRGALQFLGGRIQNGSQALHSG
jgi:hypothetical protein